jgi:hypothetical protein
MTTHQDSAQRTGATAPSNSAARAPATARRGRDLPRVPRRYGQWAAAVVLVVVTAIGAGWVWQQKSDRVEVLAVGVAVPAGSVIGRADLAVVRVAGVEGAVGIDEVDRIVGRTAAVGLVPGQLLNHDMVTTTSVPGQRERVVGLELDATRVPGGVGAGDVVTVIAVPPSGDAGARAELESPTVLAEQVAVLSAQRVEGAGTRLTVVVPSEQANRVAAFASAGRVALVQAPIGGDR